MFKHSLLFIFCFSSTFLFSQQYNFHNYSVGEGLAQSQVYAMVEDPRGYLWLGTRGGGLSRFDGLQFRTFTEDDGLPNNFVNCLSIDPGGNLWVGTDEGAAWYDGQSFHSLKFPGNNGLINDFYFGKDSIVYIATNDSGLVELQNEKVIHHYYLGSGLLTNRVWCITAGLDDDTWIGTEQGAILIRNNRAKSYGKKQGFPVVGVREIVLGNDKTLLFATYGSGLIRLKDSLVTRFTVNDGLSNNSIQSMIQDRAGRIWLGTPSGVTRISGNEVKQFSEREGLCSNVVMCVLQDSWGNTWFGTSGGGACKLDGERFIHFNEKSGDMGTWVYALHCDRKGKMWFGTSRGGVTEYDGMYYTNYYEGAGFTSAKVKAFGEDTSGTMWFGTQGDGAYKLENGSFTHFNTKNGLSQNYINAFLTDDFNRQWMATSGGGISIYDPATSSIVKIGEKQGLHETRITSLASERDQYGGIWAGSMRGGIFYIQYDSAGVTFIRQYTAEKDNLPGNFVRCIARDRYGNMWFGFAGGGISRHATPVPEDFTPHFKTYTKKDGLASDNVYLLQFDKEGNLWVGTEKGLDKILCDEKGKILSIKHYGKGEGLNGIETSLNASCLDTAGRIWFGTISGASMYTSQNDFITREAPKIHLTGIRLFFDPIEKTAYWNQDTKTKWFPIPATIELPYTQNHLRFEFNAIDLRNPEGVRFRWKLFGFDKDWSPENTDRQAIYSYLPPGEYTFKLQARNSDGFWSKAEEFSFCITPPLWETWPFRIIAGLIVLFAIGMIFSWRVRLIKRKTKRQLEKVTLEKHVLELEQKALRLQMNPHFIFNALQSIQGFIARNDSAEARKYLAKFGKLMRSTLENSRQTYTSILLETESLTHYLGLEALCHGNRFTYSIETDPGIDPEATFIPVMLIQPFVENAVIHGVLHQLQKPGKIYIRFILEDKTVICEIGDNGVGRAKAKEYEAEIKKDHKSAALEITRERLMQANEKGKPVSSLEILDLFDEEGNASGTKVVIRIGNVVFE
ncbi:MAG: two-component regulator propeller domain-containing protein [Bacteroidia bacterium]